MPRRSRILIVDHELVIRWSLEVILQRQGYEVLSASNAEAVSMAIKSWLPDVLISEIILSGRNGLDFAIEFVDAYPRCRVILLSAQVAQPFVDKATHLGFDFFRKPVAPPVILDRLKTLLQSALPE